MSRQAWFQSVTAMSITTATKILFSAALFFFFTSSDNVHTIHHHPRIERFVFVVSQNMNVLTHVYACVCVCIWYMYNVFVKKHKNTLNRLYAHMHCLLILLGPTKIPKQNIYKIL